MAAFLGAQTSLRSGDYVDTRSKTSEEPYAYLTRFAPSGTCPQEHPFTCTFNEGGKNMTPPGLRVGKGLSRERGAPRPDSQLVGPGTFQHGNGDSQYADIGTKLRNGKRQILRGKARPSGELQSYAAYHQGHTPWTSFESTVERGRNKYTYSTAMTSGYMTAHGPCIDTPVESFRLGGVSTRDAKDFTEC